MDRAVMLYTTFPSLVEAEKTGKGLVEERLAACVNILGPCRQPNILNGQTSAEEIALRHRTAA